MVMQSRGTRYNITSDLCAYSALSVLSRHPRFGGGGIWRYWGGRSLPLPFPPSLPLPSPALPFPSFPLPRGSGGRAPCGGSGGLRPLKLTRYLCLKH